MSSFNPLNVSLSTPVLVTPAQEPPIRLDPLPSGGRRIGDRQIENRDALARLPAPADGDDSLVVGQINSIDDDLRTEDIHRERHGEMVLQDGVEPARPL
jgi:hypothetical protein